MLSRQVLVADHRSDHAVAIVGANGYVGGELIKLLIRHPFAQLSQVFVRDDKWRPSQLPLDVFSIGRILESGIAETYFLCTPPEISVELVPQLLSLKKRVIDLSGAFRLSPSQAAYGLSPFALTTQIEAASHLNLNLISNPGCYATSALLALLPLLSADLIVADSVVIDAKSGTTGAGKTARESLLFSEVAEECLPYRVGCHQHIPEIVNAVKLWGKKDHFEPFFCTSLLPIRRGLISAVYARLNTRYAHRGDGAVSTLVADAYQRAYAEYPLIRVDALTEDDSHSRQLLLLRKVVGSCRAHIAFRVVGEKIFIFSLIDNLLKGAAGQAVENWNRMHGFSLETGLLDLEGDLL
jgi:N-acetyl-gamma-glutamyl-phosphate reductase